MNDARFKRLSVQTAEKTFVNCCSDYNLEGSEILFCYQYNLNNSIYLDEVYDKNGYQLL